PDVRRAVLPRMLDAVLPGAVDQLDHRPVHVLDGRAQLRKLDLALAAVVEPELADRAGADPVGRHRVPVARGDPGVRRLAADDTAAHEKPADWLLPSARHDLPRVRRLRPD